MSIGVLKIEKNKIQIATDNQVTYGNHKIVSGGIGSQPCKLYQNQNLSFASAGSLDIGILFNLYSSLNQLIHTDLLGITNYFVDFQKWLKVKSEDLKQQNEFLIVTHDKKSYDIFGLAVREIQDYSAIGSGSFLALGALHAGANAIKAVKIAKLYDLYCGGETKKIDIVI